ncbi:guanine deaminase [Phellopilus nigrolimitatus]|nr:guanine deaminase [Phellopilus nigrolimitatus]
MSSPPTVVVYYGAVVNPESLTVYTIHLRTLIAVDTSGYISWIESDVEPEKIHEIIQQKLPDIQVSSGSKTYVTLIELGEGEFIIPGFVDTHTHAPQVPNMGSGQQYELLDWLENVTFPMESRFKDVEFAKKVYPETVQRFIDSGTTTCCYYGSLHLESTKVLADSVLQKGQRAFVGKCNMNRNCPDYYCEDSTESSVEATKHLISYIRSLKSDLVHPILTPRFAISCTGDLLNALGDIAKADNKLAIQTHISENKSEIAFTKDLFPECSSYAGVYEKHGLLSERTILAHGVHLEDDEMALVKEKGAGISHCPTSNFNLRSGMAKVGEMLDRGIKVGLGTDVSGGFSPSILTVIQLASICSKMVAVQSSASPAPPFDAQSQFANKQLPLATLLYLSTMGGASLCCMADKIGSFAPGKSFDALIISTRPETRNPAVWSLSDDVFETKNTTKVFDDEKARNKIDRLLERFLFGGDDRNIMKVFVQGNCIGGSALHSLAKEFSMLNS